MAANETVATIGCVWGEDKYFDMVDGWFDCLRSLNRKPDQIVISTTPDKIAFLNSKVINQYPEFHSILDLVTGTTCVIEEMTNESVKVVKTDWISVLAIDDRLLPNAYDMLSTSPQNADVISIGMRTTLGVDIPARPIENLWAGSRSMILGPSYIRKTIWDKIGGYDSRYALSDWALWVMAARAGAKFWCSPTITHLIDINSPGRISSSPFPEDEYRKIDILRETGCFPE